MSDNTELSDADKARAQIKAAMSYRLGEFYMGSFAQAHLYHLLGLRYGAAEFTERLDAAPLHTLQRMVDACSNVIEMMQENPIAPCPCCGSVVRATQIKPDYQNMRDALVEAKLQIEYLHGKFQTTGSGNAVLDKINAALAANCTGDMP